MLSTEQNLLLARTGPETAMGDLIRRYWRDDFLLHLKETWAGERIFQCLEASEFSCKENET